jgi:Cdc6-like AAA superfamily ATPase
MARLVLILGEPGSGKTSSLRNFKKNEAQVISCTGKEFPFKSELQVKVPEDYEDVYSYIDKSTAPVVVLDDVNYLMVVEEFDRAKELGYPKFTDFAVHLNEIFRRIKEKQSNQTFYVMAHPEERNDTNNKLDFKISAGKMSKKFPIVGMTNVVLEPILDEANEFVFKTKTDGTGVKTPPGLFDTDTTPNDLKQVNRKIEEFYASVKS